MYDLYLKSIPSGNLWWPGYIIWMRQIICFRPSIHCLTSWFCFIAVRENKSVFRWYKVLFVLLALSVCISTLTIKQHVLIDVISGVVLAEGSYWFVKKSGFSSWYTHFKTKISNILIGQEVRIMKILPKLRKGIWKRVLFNHACIDYNVIMHCHP